MGDWPEIIDDTPPDEGDPSSLTEPPPHPPYPLPTIANPGAPLYPGEWAHAAFRDVGVYQRRMVGQSYESESHGLTLYDHGLGVTFGQSRGRIINHWRDVRLAAGHLLLTNHRLLLWAAAGGFHLLWSQVFSVAQGNNGAVLTPHGAAPGTPPLCFSSLESGAVADWMHACLVRYR